MSFRNISHDVFARTRDTVHEGVEVCEHVVLPQMFAHTEMQLQENMVWIVDVATFLFLQNIVQSIDMLPAWFPPREDICYSTHGWSTALWVGKETCRGKYNNLGAWLMGS